MEARMWTGRLCQRVGVAIKKGAASVESAGNKTSVEF